MLAIVEPVPKLADTAEVIRTACGDGHMVWRSWGSGPTLVLLHGGTGSWRHWARNIDELSKTHRLLVANHPGLGDSDVPPAPISPESIGRVEADGISRIIGDAPYNICGFSFGAMISGHVADIHGSRVRTLTIVGPAALGISRHSIVLEKIRSKEGAERRAANRENLARFMFHDPANIDEMAIDIQDLNTRQARLKSKGFAHTTSLRDAAGRATAKVTGLWGSGDMTAYPSIDVRIEALRTVRPDAGLVVIPDAGHWVAYEAAEAFNLALQSIVS
jgi:pimeloyl-ACP methyl ester carboxylesterase